MKRKAKELEAGQVLRLFSSLCRLLHFDVTQPTSFCIKIDAMTAKTGETPIMAPNHKKQLMMSSFANRVIGVEVSSAFLESLNGL